LRTVLDSSQAALTEAKSERLLKGPPPNFLRKFNNIRLVDISSVILKIEKFTQ
jgi:hypothetical protein